MSKQKQKSTKKTPVSWLWLGAGVVIVIAVAIALAVFFQNGQQSANPGSVPEEITVAQARQKYDQGVFFVDVRTPEEWETIHIPNTTLIPLDELSQRVNELPKDQEIVVVCRSGNRSKQGRDILRQAGFTNVTSMSGGVSAWNASGYPTEAGKP